VDVVSHARDFAARAYGSERDLDHPSEVANLVASGDQELEAAAILHDVNEDTDVEIDEIEREFGPRVAGLVATMTEDGSIADYHERKDEHRRRARDSGKDAATLFVADKLSNARRMRRGEKEPDPSKLEHYRLTHDTMKDTHPDLPLLDELDEELRIREQQTTQSSAQGPRPGARA
jgi:(p)ppGpp synthase/HD superfamily hydrolase